MGIYQSKNFDEYQIWFIKNCKDKHVNIWGSKSNDCGIFDLFKEMIFKNNSIDKLTISIDDIDKKFTNEMLENLKNSQKKKIIIFQNDRFHDMEKTINLCGFLKKISCDKEFGYFLIGKKGNTITYKDELNTCESYLWCHADKNLRTIIESKVILDFNTLDTFFSKKKSEIIKKITKIIIGFPHELSAPFTLHLFGGLFDENSNEIEYEGDHLRMVKIIYESKFENLKFNTILKDYPNLALNYSNIINEYWENCQKRCGNDLDSSGLSYTIENHPQAVLRRNCEKNIQKTETQKKNLLKVMVALDRCFNINNLIRSCTMDFSKKDDFLAKILKEMDLISIKNPNIGLLYHHEIPGLCHLLKLIIHDKKWSERIIFNDSDQNLYKIITDCNTLIEQECYSKILEDSNDYKQYSYLESCEIS